MVLVGTYDENERPNLMAAAWCGVVCSKPPCLSVSLRRATHSYKQIARNQAFSVVPALSAFAAEADFMGMSSGRDLDKFQRAGITPVEGQEVKAPYVDEWPLAIECKLVQSLELGLHTLFVGQVVDVKADEAYLTPQGGLDTEKLDPILYTPNHGTITAGPKNWAKPLTWAASWPDCRPAGWPGMGRRGPHRQIIVAHWVFGFMFM